MTARTWIANDYLATLPARKKNASALPTGAFAETFKREGATILNTVSTTSGQLLVTGIELEEGRLVSTISFVAGGTGPSGPTHQWYCLADKSLNVLGKTADDTTTAWTLKTAKTLALATPYQTTYSGLYYLGILVTTTVTQPTLQGTIDSGGDTGILAPAVNGTSTTGLTDPASLGATLAALAGASRRAYAYVS